MTERNGRESLVSDVIGMAVGVLLIGVAYSRQFDGIRYLAGDVRAEPWFNPLVAVILIVAGLACFVVASVRLLQNVRARRKP